ncbi:MAG: hypothetical protein NTY19_06375 [Planctomycetota bacterium]|nr:hypothetical protein [Planctomycetota bacterium]
MSSFVRLFFLALVSLVVITSTAPTADACGCGWVRCVCHHRWAAQASGYQSPAAAAPQQAIPDVLTAIRTASEILKMVQEARGSITGTGIGIGPGPGPGPSDGNLTELNSNVKKLLEGQEDIKGRLINSAGIGQSIGEKLVGLEARVGRIEDAVSPTGTILIQLSRNASDLAELKAALIKPKEASAGKGSKAAAPIAPAAAAAKPK